MTAIDLVGFDDKFAADADPWRTFTSHDEAVKRAAILHGLGPGPIGRVLELASGNGSNSVAIAPRALRLDATEGTPEGTRLTAGALVRWPRAQASVLALPALPPRPVYDAIVVAEILYYLSPRVMASVARMAATALRPGGCLILAHHKIDFYDFAQHARGINRRFLDRSGSRWHARVVRSTARWEVVSARLARPAVE
ncbi:nodulation S family protein [Sphingomonas sp. Leaf37]|uniref:nodulation S family protein n=1 Tax=Sphingomonas sp. Leaf37 TaxID=2876552 RepID=UPI001E4F9A2A|nr:nodulation S family protein [Sphingomonas sp. Leaf37]